MDTYNPFHLFPVVYPLNFKPTWDDGKPEVRYDGKLCPVSKAHVDGRNIVAWGGGFDAKRGAFYHDAIDLMALPGAHILAPANGKVVSWKTRKGVVMPGAGFSPRGGNFLMLELESGFRVYQSHLLELPMVRQGDLFKQGDVLARVGRTGNAKQHGKGCSHDHLALILPVGTKKVTFEGKSCKVRGGKVDPVPFLKALYGSP